MYEIMMNDINIIRFIGLQIVLRGRKDLIEIQRDRGIYLKVYSRQVGIGIQALIFCYRYVLVYILEISDVGFQKKRQFIIKFFREGGIRFILERGNGVYFKQKNISKGINVEMGIEFYEQREKNLFIY